MNENPRNEFEQALQDSLEGGETIQVDTVVNGTIVAVHGDVALVDIGGKSEAVLERDELDDLGTGDPVEVVVTAISDEIRVSRRLAIEQRLKERLNQAVDNGEPVEGKVVGRRKGGFDVTIAGVRGFCPMSQIDEHRSEDLDHHLGEVYTFKVLEYEPEHRKLVVSRAAHQREERDRLRQATMEKLEVDTVVKGTVRSVTDFGAFVDLGGVDGLVHVTEISHRRVRHPSDMLTVGDEVEAKVVELDPERQRIGLSIKQLLDNPWETATERYPSGGPFEGRVVRKADFGVFVELEEGIDGLLHVSQLPPGVELSDGSLAEGESVRGWVRDVDAEHQRIGLTMRQIPDRDPWENISMHYQPGQTVTGVVENAADFGVFVELEPGLSGLIPISELSQERGVDPHQFKAPGEEIEVQVLSLDPDRRRISLSVRALERERERQEYLQHTSSGSSSSHGTAFGQQLMNALNKPKK